MITKKYKPRKKQASFLWTDASEAQKSVYVHISCAASEQMLAL